MEHSLTVPLLTLYALKFNSLPALSSASHELRRQVWGNRTLTYRIKSDKPSHYELEVNIYMEKGIDAAQKKK